MKKEAYLFFVLFNKKDVGMGFCTKKPKEVLYEIRLITKY